MLALLLIGVALPTALAGPVSLRQNVRTALEHQHHGANALHVFGGDSGAMARWTLTIVREVIPAMRDQPINAPAGRDARGRVLHDLRGVVERNRANGLITILCPFGWTGLEEDVMAGRSPGAVAWASDYRATLQGWARAFRNDADVWLELWNEPYDWQATAASDGLQWRAEMQELVAAVRAVAPQLTVVVPAGAMGQNEQVLLDHGRSLLGTDPHLVFDLHAYERWLPPAAPVAPEAPPRQHPAQATIQRRLRALRRRGLPLIIGETGPANAGLSLDPEPLLRAADAEGLPVLAWLWKRDRSDPSALLGEDNAERSGTDTWGGLFHAFASGSLPPAMPIRSRN
ncbi:cellulase family glycosylhydrolase [Synechococcus sp. RSCCF101]|uniref:cellulase family glycosylhydrolase n=1 Tax=Synechococcus sp. RSCCF101 TaxID=2511069 RepID=UPI00177DF01F|nr:cellulase family glycosylhydrolase [Synechococcus sp. RSCCF101]